MFSENKKKMFAHPRLKSPSADNNVSTWRYVAQEKKNFGFYMLNRNMVSDM